MHYEVYSKDMLSSTTRAFGSPLRYVQGQGEFGRLPLYTAPYGNACVIIDGFLYQDLNARLEKLTPKATPSSSRYPSTASAAKKRSSASAK